MDVGAFSRVQGMNLRQVFLLLRYVARRVARIDTDLEGLVTLWQVETIVALTVDLLAGLY